MLKKIAIRFPLGLWSSSQFTSRKPFTFFLSRKKISLLLFSSFFTFECSLDNNKIQGPKHSHLWNGSQLTSETVHLRSLHFYLMKIIFPFPNYFNYFFFHNSIFKCNLWCLLYLNLKMKHSLYFRPKLWSGSQL